MTRALCIVMRRAGSIVMTGSWNNLMKSVMEPYDDKAEEHCDGSGHGTLL